MNSVLIQNEIIILDNVISIEISQETRQSIVFHFDKDYSKRYLFDSPALTRKALAKIVTELSQNSEGNYLLEL